MALPSGASFPVDGNTTLAKPAGTGDSFPVDGATTLVAVPTGMDMAGVDAYSSLATPTPTGADFVAVDCYSSMASPPTGADMMAVDVNLTNTQTPARLKMWDGGAWVPIRTYYYNTTTNAWVMNS